MWLCTVCEQEHLLSFLPNFGSLHSSPAAPPVRSFPNPQEQLFRGLRSCSGEDGAKKLSFHELPCPCTYLERTGIFCNLFSLSVFVQRLTFLKYIQLFLKNSLFPSQDVILYMFKLKHLVDMEPLLSDGTKLI